MKFISVHRIAGFFRPLTIAVLVLLGIVIIPKFINESKNNSLEVRHPGILRLTEEFAPYLNPNHPNVVKYEKKGNYEIFSLDLTSETPSKEIDALGQTSCDGYGYSACANIITKHGKVIFETVSDFFAHEDNFWEAEAMIGSFQTFTKNGVTFAYLMGEGGPCGRGMTTFLTYYHLPTGKMLYGLYYERERGKNGECCETEEECAEIEWVQDSGFEFFDLPHNLDRDNRIALDIQADTIEDAFYKHHREK